MAIPKIDELRSLAEGLLTAPSHLTPAFSKQALEFAEASGLTMPRTTLIEHPTLESGLPGKRQVPILDEAARADILNQARSLISPVTTTPTLGAVTSIQPDLDAQIAQIMEAEKARKEAGQKVISAEFEKKTEEARETGKKEVGGLEARLGGLRGTGFSSSRHQYIRGIEKDNEKFINQLNKDRQEAINKLDFESANLASERIKELRKDAFELRKQAFAEAQAALQENKPFAATSVYDPVTGTFKVAPAKEEQIKPVTLSPGETYYEPDTGETYTAPQKPVEDKPVVEQVGKSLLQYNPTTKKWDKIYSESEGGFINGIVTPSSPDGTPISESALSAAANTLLGVIGGTGPARSNFLKTFNNAKNKGTDTAWAFLRSQYVNKILSGDQRSDYLNVNESLPNYDLAIKFLEENPDIKTGFWKEKEQELVPKFNVSKDPKYATFLSYVNNAETPFRKKQYGTAITGTELSIAQRSLLNTDDDRATVLLKLKSARDSIKRGLIGNMAEGLGLTELPEEALRPSGATRMSETTRMLGPDGKQYDVPNNQVDAFIKDGGKKI